MKKEEITNLINATIKDNDSGLITAEVMRNVLNAINEGTGDGYTYIGTATPSTKPIAITEDSKVFYVASEEGDYSNFGLGNISELSMITSENGSWKSEGLGMDLQVSKKLVKLESKLVKINGFGNTAQDAGISKVGETMYNTNPNSTMYRKLRRIVSVTDSTISMETIPYIDGAIYTYNNELYVWNGEDIVNITRDLSESVKNSLARISPLEDSLNGLEESLYGVYEVTDISPLLSWSNNSQISAVTYDSYKLGEVVSVSSGKRDASDFYEIGESKQIQISMIHPISTLSIGGLAFYDKNKLALKGYYLTGNSSDSYTEKIIDIPNDAKYFRTTRWSESSGVSDNFKCNLLNIKKGVVEKIDDINKNLLNPIIGSPSIYISSPIETNYINDMTTQEVYDLYDELVRSHPNFFFRRNDLGVDASGQYSIRHYTLRVGNPYVSEHYSPDNESTNMWDDRRMSPRTICIISGVHGNEKCSIYGVYLAIKELLESSDDWATFIRSNFVLELCPVVNCWGVDNNSRNNFNGVNINRDFFETAPQQETFLVKKLLDGCNNLHAVIDSHNSIYEWGIGSVNLGYITTNIDFRFHDYYCQVASKLAAALYPRMAELMNNDNLKPYIVAWESSNNGTIAAYANRHLCLIGSTIEAPLSDYGIDSAIFNNNTKWCEVTKDLLVNTIQIYGMQNYMRFAEDINLHLNITKGL